MSNSYFQFKEFKVVQEKSAMKVCTDACVFGAFIAEKENCSTNDKTPILDIGTGTGLLSLMIAQKLKGNIDAVEIDDRSYEQARENFVASNWSSKLSLFHVDVTQFLFNRKYDIIVSNPPFFHDSLKSVDAQKNLAKHSTSLPYSQLAAIVANNLSDDGRFYILLPFNQFPLFEKIAISKNLTLMRRLDVKQREDSDFFRTIGIFTNSTVKSDFVGEVVAIKTSNGTYTEGFIKLLKDYYLYL